MTDMLGVTTPMRSVSMHVSPFCLCTVSIASLWHVVTKARHWNSPFDFQHDSLNDALQDILVISSSKVLPLLKIELRPNAWCVQPS